MADPQAPQTLPADFQGWDKVPQTLPADFNQWDQSKSGLTLSNPSTVPNARIRNLPNPAAGETSALGALYHGAKTGATLGMIPAAPAAIEAPLATVVGLGTGTVGGIAGQQIAKSAGAGQLGQEASGDLGTLLGGAVGAGVTRAATSGARAIYEALPEEMQDAIKAQLAKAGKDAAGVVGGYRLRKAIDFWDSLSALKDRIAKTGGGSGALDATSENRPYAGEPAPRPQPWNAYDATGENRPFAGGMDEWSPAQVVAQKRATAGTAGSMVQSVVNPTATQARPSPIPQRADPLLTRLRATAAKIEADEGIKTDAEKVAEESGLMTDLAQTLARVKAGEKLSDIRKSQ